MGKQAPTVCTTNADIERIGTLITQLPNNARVTVACRDNSQYSGIVCIQPTVQAFRDRDGVEGINGVLRLEDASAASGEQRIWLDQIEHVHARDSNSTGVES